MSGNKYRIPRALWFLTLQMVIMLFCFVSMASARKERPVGTAAVIDTADVIAVIKVHWVLPDVDNKVYPSGTIKASVLETFKGHISTAGISIKALWGYDDHYELYEYWPERTFLACLTRKAGKYQAVERGLAIYPINENGKIEYWASPQMKEADISGQTKWANIQRKNVDYQLAKKQLIAYLTKRHQYQRDTLRSAFTCPPAPSPQVGPTIKSLVKESTLVALIEPQWVGPANRPTDKKANLYSRVDAKVVEVLKGDKRVMNVVIGTSLDAKTGDAGSYCTHTVCLVFLRKEGDIYRAVQGRFGVFDMDGRYVVLGWPRDGKASLPRSQRILGTKTVSKEINARSSAK